MNPGPILSTYVLFLTHMLMPGAKSVEETFQSPFRDRDEHERATKNRDTLTKTLVLLERDTWSASTSVHLKKWHTPIPQGLLVTVIEQRT